MSRMKITTMNQMEQFYYEQRNGIFMDESLPNIIKPKIPHKKHGWKSKKEPTVPVNINITDSQLINRNITVNVIVKPEE